MRLQHERYGKNDQNTILWGRERERERGGGRGETERRKHSIEKDKIAEKTKNIPADVKRPAMHQ